MSAPVATLQLTFDDEFDTFNNSPSGATGWETRLPYGGTASRNLSGTGESEYYSDSSVGVNPFTDTNGVLSITAAPGPNPFHEPYNSGAITTYKSFAQQYGYFEMRAEMPAGNGLWSAFWMAPQSLDGQSELDDIEQLGNDPTVLYSTIHSVVNGVFTPDLQQIKGVPNVSTGFHTYGVDWEPNTITFYEDGVAYGLPVATPANMNEKMFMLLTLAVGGPTSWPGAPTSASEFPASYQIDYVRAYATANTKYVSGTAAIGLGAPSGQGDITGEVAVGLGARVLAQNVSVRLLDASGNTVATTTTDVHGQYQFNYVNPGAYTVKITPPPAYALQNGSTGSAAAVLTAGGADSPTTIELQGSTFNGTVLLANGGSSSALAGVVVTVLDTSGNVVEYATTDKTGTFSNTNLAAGTYQVEYTAPTGDVFQSGPAGPGTGLTGLLTVGVAKTITLSPETLAVGAPLPGAIAGSVLLGGAADAGVAVALLSADGSTTLATAVTDANGAFSFVSLVAGSYLVQYTAPSGDILQSGPADPGTGLTGALSVANGQTLALGAETLAPAPGAITGSVLLGGAADAGVDVALLSADGSTTLQTDVTDANGAFSFSGVAAGSYLVQYTAPTDDILQSGPADPGTGLTGPLSVAAGQTLTLGTETLALATGTVTGRTLLGGVALSGVTILLLDPSGADTLATTTTDSNGEYVFTGVAPGYYRIDYGPPAGDAIQSGSVNPTTGQTVVFSVSPGVTRMVGPVTFTPSANTSLSGTVDISASGTGATGAANVSVGLVNAAGTTVATTLTDANGNYQFTGFAAGSYQLLYTAPAGAVLQLGDAADPVSGLTSVMTFLPNQVAVVPVENLLTNPASLGSSVNHYGSGDRATAQSGVGVTLLDASGNVLATTLTNGAGTFQFADLSSGTYQIQYSAPTGEVLSPTGVANPVTGLTTPVLLLAGFNFPETHESVISSSTVFTLTGLGATAIRGNGSYTVTGTASDAALTLGNGKQAVTLTGSGDTVTIGQGASVIAVSGGNDTIHAGGSDTISVTDGGNLLDAGPGMNFLNTDGSGNDTFLLNGAGQGLSVISGYQVGAGDTLDLARTLAGLSVSSDLSNIGNFIKAQTSGGNTTLFVTSDGGATTYGFAQLTGVTTSVAQLLANHELSIQ